MTPKELKNSILKQAFEGKLLPHDENLQSIPLVNESMNYEVDFEIPSNWIVSSLEKVITVLPSKKYQILESQVLKKGKFIVISQSKDYSIGYSNDESKVCNFGKPIIVFGDHTTEIKVIDSKFVVGADGVKLFLTNDNLVYYKYLYYQLVFCCRDLQKKGGYSRHYKYLKEMPFVFPPLEEQMKIVENRIWGK